MKNRSYQFGTSLLTIEFGDITSATTKVIVSSDDYYITMGGGFLRPFFGPVVKKS